MPLQRLFIVSMLVLLLAACGEVRHVFPPAASIEQLAAPPDGPWQVRLRLHNQSYDAGVRFDAATLTLRVADAEAGELQDELALDVAERSSDVIELTLDASAAARTALAAGPAGRVEYRLEGRITVSNEGRHPRSYPVEQRGWLAPVPGIEHLYR